MALALMVIDHPGEWSQGTLTLHRDDGRNHPAIADSNRNRWKANGGQAISSTYMRTTPLTTSARGKRKRRRNRRAGGEPRRGTGSGKGRKVRSTEEVAGEKHNECK